MNEKAVNRLNRRLRPSNKESNRCCSVISVSIQLPKRMDSEFNITDEEIRACHFVFEVPREYADAKLILATVSSVMGVLAALSNALILLAFSKTPALRKPSHILIANLALSDFLVGVCGPIFWATDYIKRESRSTYCLSLLIKRTFMYYLSGISLFTLLVISIDRLLAVKLKATYCLIVTAKRVKLVLGVCWVMIGAYSFVLGFWNIITLKLVLRQIAVVTCLVVTSIAVSYITAAKELTKLACEVSAAKNLDSQDSNARKFDALKYRKSLKTMIIVFFATILLYVPMLCITAIKSFSNLPSHSLNLHFRITESIALANSMINPLIYVWRMGDLRQAVKKVLHL